MRANVGVDTPHDPINDQAYSTMQERVCDDVVEFFTGHWPRLVANPEVKQRVTLPGQEPPPR